MHEDQKQLRLFGGYPFHYWWSFFPEDAVTAKGAFYPSAAQLEFFGPHLGAALDTFIDKPT
jgi:hypothetical protein